MSRRPYCRAVAVTQSSPRLQPHGAQRLQGGSEVARRQYVRCASWLKRRGRATEAHSTPTDSTAREHCGTVPVPVQDRAGSAAPVSALIAASLIGSFCRPTSTALLHLMPLDASCGKLEMQPPHLQPSTHLNTSSSRMPGASCYAQGSQRGIRFDCKSCAKVCHKYTSYEYVAVCQCFGAQSHGTYGLAKAQHETSYGGELSLRKAVTGFATQYGRQHSSSSGHSPFPTQAYIRCLPALLPEHLPRPLQALSCTPPSRPPTTLLPRRPPAPRAAAPPRQRRRRSAVC